MSNGVSFWVERSIAGWQLRVALAKRAIELCSKVQHYFRLHCCKVRFYKFLAILLCVIASLLIVISRHHFLDDAFIHLRYAENLLDYHFFSYNGYETDFGTSSPGYTVALSFVHFIFQTPMSPKILSVFFYIILCLVITRFVFIVPPASTPAIILLCGLTSPSAIRWLTDGMETSLVALLSALLAIAINRLVTTPTLSRAFSCAALLAIAPLVRIEFIAIWLYATLIAFYLMVRGRTSAWDGLFIALSILVPLSALQVVFGSVFPDTSVAKSIPRSLSLDAVLDTFGTVPDTFSMLVRSHAASPVFSIFTLAAFVSGLTILIVRSRKQSSASRELLAVEVLLLFAMFFSMLALIVYRQQMIQGYRYFIWIEMFMAVYIMGALACRCSTSKQSSIAPSQHSLRLQALTVAALFFMFVIEIRLFYPVWSGRSESFRSMRHVDRTAFTEMPCAAYDIGMFGYFYNCRVIDINGLVNGREYAKLSHSERLERLSHQDVKLLFVNESQRTKVSSYISPPLSQWHQISNFAFPNVGGDIDTHYVLIAR